LFASAPGQRVLHQLAKRSRGPNEKELRMGRSRLWGEVRNAAGEKRTARLETANGYWLTVNGTLMAVEFLLKNALPGGYYTPSMLMGSRCVEQLPGSTLNPHPVGVRHFKRRGCSPGVVSRCATQYGDQLPASPERITCDPPIGCSTRAHYLENGWLPRPRGCRQA